jgi:hypothetical protein
MEITSTNVIKLSPAILEIIINSNSFINKNVSSEICFYRNYQCAQIDQQIYRLLDIKNSDMFSHTLYSFEIFIELLQASWINIFRIESDQKLIWIISKYNTNHRISFKPNLDNMVLYANERIDMSEFLIGRKMELINSDLKTFFETELRAYETNSVLKIMLLSSLLEQSLVLDLNATILRLFIELKK